MDGVTSMGEGPKGRPRGVHGGMGLLYGIYGMVWYDIMIRIPFLLSMTMVLAILIIIHRVVPFLC